MQEQNILNGGIEKLQEIKSALQKKEALKEEVENIIIRSGKLEGDIAAEKKLTKDSVDEMVRKRTEEVSASFDKEINEEKGKLRAARSKRDKAKNKGIDLRIEDETQEHRKSIGELKREIKTGLKSKGVPGICNTSYYYAMYCASSLKEWLIFAATMLILLLGVPCLFYMALDWFWFWKMLLVICFVVAVLTVYITVWLNTKNKFRPVISEMRGKKDEIAEHKKQIKKIKKKIKKDKDESLYNLDSFDEEINEIQGRIKLAADKKSKALDDFDQNVRPAIEEEIAGRNIDKITGMENELNELTSKRRNLELEAGELSHEITSSYEAFIGKDYMSVNRIDDLAGIINDGNAADIKGAISYMKEHQLL